MKREKISADPLLLESLIAIYSLNNASLRSLRSVLKIPDAKLEQLLAQLTMAGILTGNAGMDRSILMSKNEAKQRLYEHGISYSAVEFFERIYQYQSSIQASQPEQIKDAAPFIHHDAAAFNKSKPGDQQIKRLSRFLFIAAICFGVFALLVVMVPEDMSKFKRMLFSVSVMEVSNPAGTEIHFDAVENRQLPVDNIREGERLVLLDQKGIDTMIDGRKGNWLHVKQSHLTGWVFGNDLADIDAK